MSNNYSQKNVKLVRDVIPKEIIQKANQYDKIEDVPNLNKETKIVEFLLFMTYFKYKNITINDFLKNIGLYDVTIDNLEQFFGSFDYQTQFKMYQIME